MLEFKIMTKVLNIGRRKGQTVHYAQAKSLQRMTDEMVVERIVRETSLSEGDVRNALISLGNVVCDALQMGMSVNLAELGNLRLNVPSRMMDTAEEVTVGECPQGPENHLHPHAEDARRGQRGEAGHRPPVTPSRRHSAEPPCPALAACPPEKKKGGHSRPYGEWPPLYYNVMYIAYLA